MRVIRAMKLQHGFSILQDLLHSPVAWQGFQERTASTRRFRVSGLQVWSLESGGGSLGSRVLGLRFTVQGVRLGI